MDASIRDTSGTYQPWVDSSSEKVAENENVKDRLEKILFKDTIRPMALTGPLNIFLICVPIAIISYAASWPSSVTFIFSLLALAPLAERLGYVTESLAMHTNDTIGGLLNATFGNATELIVAITAMKRGLFRLVQLSLLGSILSNMLLVLGCSFLAGGYYHKTQTFGTISSQMNSTLLMIATMGITFPAILSGTSEESNLGELGYSRGTSLVLFLLYFAFLYFQVCVLYILQYNNLCPILLLLLIYVHLSCAAGLPQALVRGGGDCDQPAYICPHQCERPPAGDWYRARR